MQTMKGERRVRKVDGRAASAEPKQQRRAVDVLCQRALASMKERERERETNGG